METRKSQKALVIVTGGPGTGKSYAATKIKEAIPGLTTISYDEIKEKEFDRFGFDNEKEKERLNWFSLEEFYLTLRYHMWLEEDIMIEYPFYQRHKELLAELIEDYDYQAVTVYLYGDWRVIYERGVNRDRGENRHLGHLTTCYHKGMTQKDENFVPDTFMTYEEFRRALDVKNYDICLGYHIPVDITDFSKVDYGEVAKKICEQIGTKNY